MEKNQFQDYCIKKDYDIGYLAYRLSDYSHRICDPQAILDDLYAENVLRWTYTVRYEFFQTEKQCFIATRRKSKDVFAEFEKRFLKQQKFLKKISSDHIFPITTTNDMLAVEMKDVLNYLHKNLKKEEYELFYYRVCVKTDYEELAGYFNSTVNALKTKFGRVAAKIEILLVKDKYAA